MIKLLKMHLEANDGKNIQGEFELEGHENIGTDVSDTKGKRRECQSLQFKDVKQISSHLSNENDNAVDADDEVVEQELETTVDLGEDCEHNCKAKLDGDAQACAHNNLDVSR